MNYKYMYISLEKYLYESMCYNDNGKLSRLTLVKPVSHLGSHMECIIKNVERTSIEIVYTRQISRG